MALWPAPVVAQGSSVQIEPGQSWTASLPLDGTLEIEARIPFGQPAGANYVLEVAVNGRLVAEPLLNKQSPMRYADGRNFPYREPNSARWMLFYSHDYAANNGSAGGVYEVRTDPGQAYRYVWNVAPLMEAGAAQVQFRNVSEPPVPVEVRVLSAAATRYSTGSPSPAPAPKKKGWLGGLSDVVKDVTKTVGKPASTTAATTPTTPAGLPSTPYGGSMVQGRPHLAMYAVGQILGHSDFDYPIVVQLQDGAGQPMYPPAPLTVTITSRQPDVVRFYGASRPDTTTATLKPAGSSGAGGLSWDMVRVTAANNWVAGTATFVASAPGYPEAAVTVTTLPARTRDNQSTPAQTAPAARVSLTVMPPVVEVDRRPIIWMDLLDARGQPTGVDFGPGAWTLDSSNPAVFPGASSSGRNAVLLPTGPGQTRLNLRSKRAGVVGGDATLTVITPGAPASTEYRPPPAERAHDSPHLAVYAAGQILGHSDFDYPLVVQLQDAAGRPMYPPSPLTVTITSRQPDIVRFYGAARPDTATVTLKPAGRSGTGGASWDKVRVTAASNWVVGASTFTVTAPGYPDAAITISTLPTRTRDNRSTPAQTAPAARVSLLVMPPVTEVDHRPVIWMDLVDARGQPTGVDFGPGEWVLESSNPAVYRSYPSSGRSADLTLGVGQTRVTVRSKRPGIAGSDAPLEVITPGAGAPVGTGYVAPPPQSSGDAPPFPAPGAGRVKAGIDFGDPVEPARPSGRISNIVTARRVLGGEPAEVTDRFTPDVNPIHVWFRLNGFAPGNLLTSRWTYLGGAAPMVIGTGEFTVDGAAEYGTFSYELAQGKRWPAGSYRVEILFNGTMLGAAAFLVDNLSQGNSVTVPPSPEPRRPPEVPLAASSLRTGTVSTRGSPVEMAVQTVPPGGGTVAVNRPGDPLHGLTVTVSPGSYPTARAFRISSQPIASTTFPHVNPLTPLIHVDNGGAFAGDVMTVKVPVKVPAGHFAMAFFYDAQKRRLEGIPTVAMDPESITIATGHFSYFFVSSVDESRLTGDIIDSGFWPGRDEWQFANHGTAVVGGRCAGTSASEIWYFYEKPDGPMAHLYGRYEGTDGQRTPDYDWDDVEAQRFVVSVQVDYEERGVRLEHAFRNMVRISDTVTVKLFAYSILVTSGPQLIEYPRHAMVATAVKGDTIFVADPNYPGTLGRTRWTDGKLEYVDAAGSTAESPVYYAAVGAMVGWDRIAERWAEFKTGKAGHDIFPPSYKTYVWNRDEDWMKRIPLRNVDGTQTELVEGLTIPIKVIGTYSEAPNWTPPWLLASGKFVFEQENPVNGAVPGGCCRYDTTLEPGPNTVGVFVEGKATNGTKYDGPPWWHGWLGYDWFTVNYLPPTRLDLSPSSWTGAPGQSQAFTVTSSTPLTGLRFEWLLDGQRVQSERVRAYTFRSAAPGAHTLTVNAWDDTYPSTGSGAGKSLVSASVTVTVKDGAAPASGLLTRLHETNRFSIYLTDIVATYDVYDGKQTRRDTRSASIKVPVKREFILRWSGNAFSSRIDDKDLNDNVYQADLQGTVSGDGLTITSLSYTATAVSRSLDVNVPINESRVVETVEKWAVQMANMPAWDDQQFNPNPLVFGLKAGEYVTGLTHSREETRDGKVRGRKILTGHRWNAATGNENTIDLKFWTR